MYSEDFFLPATRQALAVRLRRLTPGSRRRWGRMSAHDTVCHLCDAFRVALGEIATPDASTPVHRTVVRWVAFHTAFPWPKGAPTVAELDRSRGGGTPAAEFAADVRELESLMERFGALGDAIAGMRHPLFGPMSRLEWSRWASRHTDHHLRQFGL